jgi:formylglycine-generating enzyme required for sulfatase activity
MPTQDFSMYKTLVGDDNREMVEIPEGPFTMGIGDGDPDEGPAHPVYLQTFYMDVKEVTQEDYERFVKMTKRKEPKVPVFEDKVEKLVSPDFPVVGLTWNDAFGYCRWAGKRLPTEAEWEKAARGEGERRYPWGNKFEHTLANVDGIEDGFQYLAPVGSFEVGRSPFGLYDATGNVAEWVMDDYTADYYQKASYRDPQGPKTDDVFKVIRGGSWRESRLGARVTKRFSAKMWRTDATIGFRCAKDPPTVNVPST